MKIITIQVDGMLKLLAFNLYNEKSPVRGRGKIDEDHRSR
jgi:hypothetical protein